MNDTTFHTLSLSFRSAHVRVRKVPRVVSKNTSAWFFSHHARERVRSLFLSLLSEDFFERSASDDSIVVAESKSEEAKFQTTTLYTKRTFFILDLRFHVIDGIRRLHFQGDGFARQGFHENLHLLLLRLVY